MNEIEREIRNVRFQYPGRVEFALKQVSFNDKKGDKIAILEQLQIETD